MLLGPFDLKINPDYRIAWNFRGHGIASKTFCGINFEAFFQLHAQLKKLLSTLCWNYAHVGPESQSIPYSWWFSGTKYSWFSWLAKRPCLPLPAVQAANTKILSTKWLNIAQLQMFCPPKITGYTVYVVMLACNYVWPILKEQPSDTSGAPLKIKGGAPK